MLKVFRDNLKNLSWVLWLVIAVFILLVFVDFGGTIPGGPGGVAAAAAVVGSREISFSEFERAYRQAESTYREAYGGEFTSELARQIGLPQQVLDQLVTDKILDLEADRLGLFVTDDELRRQILNIPAFQTEQGRFVGQELYERILRSNGFTVDDFEQIFRQQMLAEKVRSVLSHTVYVSDGEVEAAFRERAETARIRFVTLPTDSFRDGLTAEPGEVEAWYESHRDAFRIPERRVVDYLLVDRAALQEDLGVQPAEIQAYYDEHPEEFRTEERVRARHILLQVNDERDAGQAAAQLEAVRARLAGGEAFEALARELSEDPGSAKAGGDLGYFGRGQMVPAFEEAAFAAAPGEVVGPVVTSFGAHLIEVLDKSPGGLEPFDEAAPRIRGRLLGERARTAAESAAQQLAARARRESASLGALAEGTAGVTFHTTPPFGRDDNVDGIGRSTAFTVAAFDMAPGEVGEPVKIARGWAILQVAEVQAPRVAELPEVRDRVEAAMLEEKARQLARTRMALAKGSLESGRSLDDVAAELGLEVRESDSLGRGASIPGLGRAPEVIAAALSLSEGAIGGPVVTDSGVVLLEVTERGRFDPQAFAAAREETRSRLENERFGALLSELIAARREELGVRYAPELVDNFDLASEAGPATL